jgi:hypothetical protein
MKILLVFLFALGANLTDRDINTVPSLVISGNQGTNLVGKWKKVAGGQDANKNRILEESEKMKLEPGAQDNLDFRPDGKCNVFGMEMNLKASYKEKNVGGKRMIYVYAEDDADLPAEDRESSALKFEIVALEGDRLVVIPPTFTFLLAVYSRSK